MKNKNFNLESLQQILTDEEMDSALVQPNEEMPAEHLLVYLGSDYQNRERILQIDLVNQELGKEISNHSQAFPDLIITSFRVGLPFQVEDLSVNQTNSLLMILNRNIELPGFELDELEGKVSYRYSHLSGTKKSDSKLYIAIIGLIMLILELFTEAIEKVATGKMSLNDLLEQMTELENKLEL